MLSIEEIKNTKFHSFSTNDTLLALESSESVGLSDVEADSRSEIFGQNSLRRSAETSVWRILINQLKSPLIYILLGAGLITGIIGHYKDSIFIFVAVLINTALGFYQEYKAGKAIEELKSYLRQRCRVVRNGVEKEIDAEDLVPGDIIRLSQGDRVPADARIIFANDLQVDEAILTGESLPVVKSSEAVAEDAVLADQLSMVFAGTLVQEGYGSAIVCRTDSFTEIGRIASLVSSLRAEETPLQGAINRFSVWISGVLLILTALIFFVGLYSGYSWIYMFTTSVALAVSAIPEGLPIAMTVVLAIGVQRMARRKGVVRRLVAAESLGGATVILTDKTGTLTTAQMEVSSIISLGDYSEEELLRKSLYNANVIIENIEDDPQEWRIDGRAIEIALVRSAGLRGILMPDNIKNQVVRTLPFNAVNKYSAVLLRSEDGGGELVVLGAADVIIRMSDIPKQEQLALLEKTDALARNGELVLAIASRKMNNTEIDDYVFEKSIHHPVKVLGLFALHDPVRETAREALRLVAHSGIKVVMVTGDHRGTAEAVARQLGMSLTSESVVDASELRQMSEEELMTRLPQLKIVSRVSPEDKLRILKAFQAAGEVVAMSGDGVNDAPTIKQADIGIAMGSGTDVARDVADIVLLDDNFEIIYAAIEEGRRILANLRRVIMYLLSNVADGFFLIGGSLLANITLPLNALQILWVNFFTDSFTAVAFAFEKNAGEGKIGYISGRRINILNRFMSVLILFKAIFSALLLFGLHYWLVQRGYPEIFNRTFIFACFGVHTLLVAFPARDLKKSIFSYNPFSNKFLALGIVFGLLLMGAAIYLPFFNKILETVPLPPLWLIAVLGVGLIDVFIMEIGKKLFSGLDTSSRSGN